MNDEHYSLSVELWDVTDFATLNDLQESCEETGASILVDNGRVYLSYLDEA